MGRKSRLPDSDVQVIDRGDHDDALIATVDRQGRVRCFCGNRLSRTVLRIDGATLDTTTETRCLGCGAQLVGSQYVPGEPLAVSLRAWPEIGES